MKTKYPRMFGILAALMLVASFVVPTSLVSPSAVQADLGICKWDKLAEPGAAYGMYSIRKDSETIDWSLASDGSNAAAIVRLLSAGATINILLYSPAQSTLYWSPGVYSSLLQEPLMYPYTTVAGGALAAVQRMLYQVIFSPDDPKFFAVTSDGSANSGGSGMYGSDLGGGPKEVWVTTNGGADWSITNFQAAASVGSYLGTIRFIDISVDYGGRRDIGVGVVNGGVGSLWICQSTGFSGWQRQITAGQLGNVDFFAGKFSPSYPSDAAMALVFAGATGTYYNIALRDLNTNAILGWAFTATGPEVVDPLEAGTGISPTWWELNKADLELPSDFSGQAASLRRAYISLDTHDCGQPKPAWDGIVRMDNNTVYMLMDTYANPDKSIYSIAYFGTYASGKLLAGDRMGYPCDATVPTYFTDSPTTCPVPCWYECLKCTTGAACGAGACNCPTTGTPTCAVGVKNGVGAPLVIWRPNGQLAFVATGSLAADNGTSWYHCWTGGYYGTGSPTTGCDESAFAISRNNGETWNQVSLIDTQITRFTDVAPSPDCKTVYVASVNTGCFATATSGPCTQTLQVWCDNTTDPTPTFGWSEKGVATCGSCNTSAGADFAGILTGTYNPTLCGCVYSVSGNWTYLCNCGVGGCVQVVPMTKLTNQFIACSSNTTIVVTAPCNCDACCGTTTQLERCCGFDSVWRSSSNIDVVSPISALPVGSLWERVFTHVTAANCLLTQSNVGLLRLVPWCEDPTGEIVAWAAMDKAVAFWSPDFGDYWAQITVRNPVQDFCFESRTMLWFLAYAGLVQKMPYTGTAWSTSLQNVNAGVAPAHSIVAKPEGQVIVGRAYGSGYPCAVCVNGDTDLPVFSPLTSAGPLTSGTNAHVFFDPNYADNGIFYMAMESGTVYRNSATKQVRWPDVDMLAVTNGALNGCIYPSSGFTGIVAATTGQALYVSSQTAGYGVYRTIDDGTGKFGPLSGMPKPGIAWDQLTVGLSPADGALFTAQPTALKACGCCTEDTNTSLFAIDYRDYQGNLYNVGDIWFFTDCLAKRGPTLITEDKTLIGCDPVSGRAQEVNMCWEQLCVASEYDIEIAKNENFSILVIDIVGENSCWGFEPADVTTPCAYIPAGGTFTWGNDSSLAATISGVMECGHTYYWRVKARACATTQTVRSPWSEVRSFTVKAGLPVTTPYYGPQLLAPNNGCLGCPVQPVSFSWSPFKETTKYKFVLAKDAAMTQIVKEAEVVASTAFEYDGALDYSTNYFWRIMSMEPAPSDWSATFSFQTETAPAPTAPAEKAPPTPFWVWVVIAIGAILVIVTLVLIFKTRRV